MKARAALPLSISAILPRCCHPRPSTALAPRARQRKIGPTRARGKRSIKRVYHRRLSNPRRTVLCAGRLHPVKRRCCRASALALVCRPELQKYHLKCYSTPENAASDRTFVLNAVKQDWQQIRWASRELQADTEIIMTAVRQSWRALRFISVRCGDRRTMVEAISQCGRAFYFATDELRADRDLCLLAVSSYPNALRWASEDLQKDQAIVRTAVLQDPIAIEHACPNFLHDEAFMREFASHCVVLQVFMLSGRSCIAAFTTLPHDQGVLDRCAYKLGLTYEQKNQADLVVGTATVTHLHLSLWPGVVLGQVNEAQLLVRC